jgi:serine O-acetyltransferase
MSGDIVKTIEPPRSDDSTNSDWVPPSQCDHDLRSSWQCLRADWERNNSGISKLVLLVYRFGHLLHAGHLPRWVSTPLWPVYRAADLVWMKLLAGAELPHNCCIGGGLRLAHGGRGVVIGLNTVIGSNVAIYHQASVGAADTRDGVWPLPCPVIEDDVRIGTGARVLGDLRIGAGAMIGANAVVLNDVPAGKTAAGNPARVFF